ncbi:MAG TPA: DUF2868 domain-containing protein [Planctomycetota bacterium]
MLNIADVVDLEVQLRRDAGAETAERDRAIGRRLGKMEAPRSLLKGWLAELRRGEGFWPGETVRRGLRLFRWVLVALGLALGAGAGFAAFALDGGAPINVVRAWGLLVGLQLLLLALTLLLLLRRSTGPGLWLHVILGVLKARDRARVHEFLERAGRHRALIRWWVVESFQIAAVAANVAILAAVFIRLPMWSLAFGWETTLDWSPALVQRLTAWISTPWAAACPGAVPSADLVTRSEYLRFAEAYAGPGSPAEVALLSRRWWPFLVLSVLVYGLLPRLVLLVVARCRQRREESTAFERGGDYRLLLDRLRGAVLSSQEDPATARPNEPRIAGGPASPEPTFPAPRAVVLWQLPSTALAANSRTVPVHALTDPEQEPRAIEAIAGAPGESVLVLVPAWGNATNALKIFLRALRARLGQVPVRIAPVDEDGAAGSDAVRNIWRVDLADLRDAWIQVGAP